MMNALILTLSTLSTLSTLLIGQPVADRAWQPGKWADIPASRGRANIRTYAIDTEDFHYEVEEPPAPGTQPLKTRPGASVAFAVESDIVYIREDDGREHRLRLLKSTRKLKHYPSAGPGHFIRATADGGQTITLEDGSVWEIDPTKQFTTEEWRPLDGITVHAKPEEFGFNYILNNADADDWALARLVSLR
jgi:hypothetical protein